MTYECLQKIHQPLEQLFHFSAVSVPVSHQGWSPKCLPEYTPPFGTFISLSYLLLWSSISVACFPQSPVQRADPSDSVTTEEWALLVINLCFPSKSYSWHQHEQYVWYNCSCPRKQLWPVINIIISETVLQWYSEGFSVTYRVFFQFPKEERCKERNFISIGASNSMKFEDIEVRQQDRALKCAAVKFSSTWWSDFIAMPRFVGLQCSCRTRLDPCLFYFSELKEL